MAMNDTKATDSPLAPVVDKTYCKKQTYMESHTIYTLFWSEHKLNELFAI